MSTTCPECGADWSNGSNCQEIFDRFLALEFTDPEYGIVHFLTVACFMIQHGRYSDQGLRWIQGKLRAYLEEGQSTDEIRRQANREASNATRTWKVTRQADEPPLPQIDWLMTIVDVANRYQDAAGYREQITEWARRTLDEMSALPACRE